MSAGLHGGRETHGADHGAGRSDRGAARSEHSAARSGPPPLNGASYASASPRSGPPPLNGVSYPLTPRPGPPPLNGVSYPPTPRSGPPPLNGVSPAAPSRSGPPPLNGVSYPPTPRSGPPPLGSSSDATRSSTGASAPPTAAPISQWLRHPESLRGSVLEERYQVHTVLGRGALGVVVEAAALNTKRNVVLKLLPMPPEHTRERFVWRVREATALAHFEHPNVEPVFDFGGLPDRGMFLVRHQSGGLPLRLALRQGRLPLRRALVLGRQIAHALASAHAREIVHGRLKPENLLVGQGADESEQVKLVDFGIGTLGNDLGALAPVDTREHRLRTRLYWPARYDGSELPEPHIDLHSLGVILFEMITGQPPILFDVNELGSQPPRPAPSFGQYLPPGSVPRAVEDVVQALLHPAIAQRGPSAEQVFGALDALLAGRTLAGSHSPPSAHPPARASQRPARSSERPARSSERPARAASPRPPPPPSSFNRPPPPPSRVGTPPSRRQFDSEELFPTIQPRAASYRPAPPAAPAAPAPPLAATGAPIAMPPAYVNGSWQPPHEELPPPAWQPGHLVRTPPAPPPQFAPPSAPVPGPAQGQWPAQPPLNATWPSVAPGWAPPVAPAPYAGAPAAPSRPPLLNATKATMPPRRSPFATPPVVPDFPDEEGLEFRSGLSGAWSKLRSLVGRKRG